MNRGQESAFNAVQEGKSIFLTGPGGTGKSYLIHRIFESTGFGITPREIALTALTGCAALLLHPKAKTIHSWAGIGLGKEPVSVLVKNIRKMRNAVKRWMSTDVLIIDEISMMTAELFEKLEEIARKVRRIDRPFGGLQIVLVGDFFQLPPVADSQETQFIFESPVWKSMALQTCEWTEIVRQADPVFQGILNEARKGNLSPASLKILKKRMRLDINGQAIKPTMLFTRRAEVDLINMSHLKKLEGDRQTFKATTRFLPSVTVPADDMFLQKAIRALDMNSSYTETLTLVIGAQVMLLINKNPGEGLVNGSRGVVVGFETVDAKLLPVVQFRNGLKMPIEYNTWEVGDFPGVMRSQIPLRLAYAITIHKAQGATLDCALIDVGDRTFEYGQAYVALSRLKDLEGLYIHDIDASAFRAHPKVLEFYESIAKDIH